MAYATSKEAKAARTRLTLEFLNSAGGSSTRSLLWSQIEAAVPLEEDEHVLSGSGNESRAVTDWIWSTTNMVKSGWMSKDGRGGWNITDAGREALERFEDPGDLAAAARNGYAQWDRENKAALGTKIVPVDDQQKRVIQAAEYFVQRALATGESVFAPGRTIWTPELIDEVHRHFVEAERADGNFVEQLEGQFVDASDDARLLVAELVTLQLLPASTDTIGEAAKRQRITRILNIMDHPVVIPTEISAAFGSGSFGMGQLLAGHIVNSLELLVNFTREWVRLDSDTRDRYLSDPWAFRDFVMGVGGPNLPSQRFSLMYLVHPDTFRDIVSSDAREAIRSAFIGEIGESTGDLDLDLLRITLALQKKLGGPANFYQAPLLDRWKKARAAVKEKEADDQPSQNRSPSAFRRVTAELANSLHVDASWLQETLDLLERRRQLIFFGPPGTGKTFIAKAIAEHATGRAPRIVQFHPSYSYEDFVEGYRPAEGENGMVYRIKPGPFLTLSQEAEKNPEENFVLVIDEINRGNVAKIFGELYFLLEYRSEPIQLLYGETEFRLPANLFIVGTMNTSDRSIALLDAAMRRRFAFVELHPDRQPVRGVLPAWLAAQGMSGEPALLLAELNSLIPDSAYRIGPSYLMPEDRDLSETRLRAIWKHELMPLLEEVHYGEKDTVGARFGLDALRSRLRRAAPTVDSEAVDDGDD